MSKVNTAILLPNQSFAAMGIGVWPLLKLILPVVSVDSWGWFMAHASESVPYAIP